MAHDDVSERNQRGDANAGEAGKMSLCEFYGEHEYSRIGLAGNLDPRQAESAQSTQEYVRALMRSTDSYIRPVFFYRKQNHHKAKLGTGNRERGYEYRHQAASKLCLLCHFPKSDCHGTHLGIHRGTERRHIRFQFADRQLTEQCRSENLPIPLVLDILGGIQFPQDHALITDALLQSQSGFLKEDRCGRISFYRYYWGGRCRERHRTNR